ncbi:MAG: glycosyltransferase N-terminal domain-containing protein, partial [Pseudomonadota bacterium]
MTLLLRAYAGAARLALPWAMRREEAKLSAAGMGARLPEKRGETRVARPPGPLIWLHAASVGESLSALALIERLSRRAFILVTTGTATSAELMGKRLPAGALHQFAPLDAPAAVARFLDHWAPDAAIFVESELWPNILRALDARGIPRALVNARLSEASLRAWRRRPASARALLAPFKLILTQSAALSTALEAMGASAARPAPDLKSMAPPLPTDPDLMALVPSPAWVAASTHPGEEDLVLNAHAILLEYHPKLTLLLAPRHPERGEEVASYIARRGWPVA